MLNLFILLQAEAPRLATEPEQSSFWFWFICESFGAAFVFLMLYIFFIKNPKINPPRQRRRDEEN
ncbi:MAG: hypothetical protein ACEQSR_05115 [Candidatus Methylacidiphilales bacterium]